MFPVIYAVFRVYTRKKGMSPAWGIFFLKKRLFVIWLQLAEDKLQDFYRIEIANVFDTRQNPDKLVESTK